MTTAADLGNGSLIRLTEFVSATQAASWRARDDLPVGGFAPGKEFQVVDSRPATMSMFPDLRVVVADYSSNPPVHYAIPTDELQIFDVVS
jgi:hypothetical protein